MSNSTPHPVDVHVGARIRLRRKMAGASQNQLGQALGLTFQQLQKYERGANRISASRLHDLSVHLETPVAWFFEGLVQPGVDEESARRLIALETLLSTPDGSDLIAVLPRLPARQRRQVLALVHSLVAVEGLPLTV
ncbi:helix-turn-helix domain-containing protein [Caulobacter sp. 602-1]|uniref:helix-turn-helix domain-containing protein n=1 Tax=Caulobacter sp. 602-1 TaxID=2492472 RepID=UPI000F62FA03|nr:helix-turn-helix transcriptional regulator [Caulobacter sp. 602-1]RRN63479.1 XRE family transcriptional regulator [Caulobacter sp. 602-1]